ESKDYAAGLRSHGWGGLVVEERERAVRLAPCIVLPCEPDAAAETEVASLSAQPPDDPAGSPAHLVDGMRVPGREEEVSVVVHVDRVEVEVVEHSRRIARRSVVRLAQRDVVVAEPF